MKRSSAITWDQLKVGLVILASLAILTVAIYKLGQAANLFAKRYDLVTFLANSNGIRPGGSVMVGGQLSGTVKDIQFLPVSYDTTRKLKLILSINENVRTQVRRDSRAKIRTMGLLGDKLIDISPGTPRYPILKPGDTISVEQSLDYEAVLAQAAGAVGDMVSLTHDLKDLSGGIARGQGTLGQLVTNRAMYDELTGTLTRSNALLTRLQNPNGSIGRMLDDPALYNKLVGTISSTDSLIMAMNDRKGTVGRFLHDDSLYTQMIGITRGADSLMTMLTKGKGFASKMLSDQQLYDQLEKLVTDLGAILGDVRKDPHRYFKGLVKVF